MLVTETGEPDPGRPEASYRNILGAGFKPAFRRPFWRQRAHRAAARADDA
jgi:hypothetical protein